jgi:hypothetical protein
MAVHSINANGNYPDDNGVRLDHPKSLMVENPAGATVTLQYNPSTADAPASADWRNVDSGAFTALTVKNVAFDTPVKVRINVTGYSTAFTVEL